QAGTGDSVLETFITKERDPEVHNQNARLGLDYQIGRQTTVGVLLSGYINQWNLNELSNVAIRPIGASDTLIQSFNTEENDWKNLQTNLHLSHQFTSTTNLDISLDYLFYNNDNPANYDQRFSLDTGTALRQEQLFSGNQTDFGIWVAKLDYQQTFAKKGKWGNGVKYVNSDFQNRVLVTMDEVVLPNFTNNGDLLEGVYAAYTQAEYPLSDKTQVKAGLRYEFSDTDLISDKDGQVVDREFGEFFPSVYLNHQLTETQQINLSYSRRINRPSFSDMASFVFFLDPNTSFSGNARLQPAIANTIQADYRYKTINLTLQYTHEDSTIARFQNRFDPELNRQLILPINLRDQQIFNASIAFPWKAAKWWQMRYFVQYTHTVATTVDEDFIDINRQNSVFLNGNQTFTLAKNWSFELSGFWRSRQLNGNVRIDPTGVLNAGLQKKLANGSRLTLNVTDVFDSFKFNTATTIPANNFAVERLFDFSQRTFKLTYLASFGNNKVKKARTYRQAEEARRVN
ncbi:MAG: outer membrane beta-barrel family protein, partial [Saprospiraceae bacterium]